MSSATAPRGLRQSRLGVGGERRERAVGNERVAAPSCQACTCTHGPLEPYLDTSSRRIVVQIDRVAGWSIPIGSVRLRT